MPGKLPFKKTWQKSSVVYQIYPSSFKDSNGDGIGDLQGIYSELDYIRDLGTDIIWLSPIYTSPMADMGYDISDYRDIDPRYGTLADWDYLIAGVHERGMKLIMDLVVNHTSDEHAWFRESRSSRDSPKRDWYIWRPPQFNEKGERIPPNNWRSLFQGSAWEWDEHTQEYYLHVFLDKQPDLNWENPVVRKEVFAMMNFWLDRGCDGFRLDVINFISKVPELPDAPVDDPDQPWQWAVQYFANGPRVHEYLREMNREVLSDKVFTVGEAPCATPDELAEYVLPANKELDMCFQFEHLFLDQKGNSTIEPGPWKLSEFKGILNSWQTLKREEGFWNSVFIQNHDNAWAVSRFGDDSDEWRGLSAKLLAMMEICQGGTLFLYQGEELGMNNSPRSWGIEEYHDPATINFYYRVLKQRQCSAPPGTEIDMSDIMDGIAKKARDHARRPMQWSAESHAGFTSGKPWMNVNDDYETWNVKTQKNSEDSVLEFWRRALKLRASQDVLIYGDFTLLCPEHEQIFVFIRSIDTVVALVVLNFSSSPAKYDTSEIAHLQGRLKLLFANYETTTTVLEGCVHLRGWEGHVYLTTSKKKRGSSCIVV